MFDLTTPELPPDSVESGTRPLVAFNARTMSVGEIVRTFVEPPEFGRLRRPVNSLLSGPRGSGKTTMMKMLQPAALELWTSPDAANVSADIPYTGVFVPTDRAWKRQIEPQGRDENLLRPEVTLIGESAFTSHVLREIVSAMRHRVSPLQKGPVSRTRATLADSGVEAQLASNIARVAGIESFEPSLKGIADALTIRISSLQGVQRLLKQGRYSPIPDWAGIECLAAATAAIDLFNRAVNQESHQWAILFDEMELAPTAIVQSLLDAMRGQPQNILMKLSISPVQPELSILNLPYTGVSGQDFELIQLANARQAHAVEIGRRMLLAECQRRDILVHPSKLLGKSVFASSDDGDGGHDRADGSMRSNPYALNSSLWNKYRSLATIDDSFRAWLSAKEVELDKLESLSPTERASKVRKIRNLVVVREHYRKSGAVRRGRKSYSLYTGMDTIVGFCDGNPRLLTALLGQILAPDVIRRDAISIPVQSFAIESVISRFFALIDSAEGVTHKSGGIATLSELVNRIGEALSDRVIQYGFSDNVPLSFSVDRGLSEETLKLLRSGINLGVFVHIPQRSDQRVRSDVGVPLDLANEHFRLSYVLSPYFGLPVRLGRAARLSDLLKQRPHQPRASKANKLSRATGDSDQYVLFLEPRMERR